MLLRSFLLKSTVKNTANFLDGIFLSRFRFIKALTQHEARIGPYLQAKVQAWVAAMLPSCWRQRQFDQFCRNSMTSLEVEKLSVCAGLRPHSLIKSRHLGQFVSTR
jgi:hypothetical protein